MQEKPNTPISDVFATQGILAVGCGLAICILHLWKPQTCAVFLYAWKRMEAESSDIAAILLAWFAWVKAWFS